jgi:hypothetical protein
MVDVADDDAVPDDGTTAAVVVVAVVAYGPGSAVVASWVVVDTIPLAVQPRSTSWSQDVVAVDDIGSNTAVAIAALAAAAVPAEVEVVAVAAAQQVLPLVVWARELLPTKDVADFAPRLMTPK